MIAVPRRTVVGQSHLTLNMASARVVETSDVNNSPSQNSSHPDNQLQSRYVEMKPAWEGKLQASASHKTMKNSLLLSYFPCFRSGSYTIAATIT